MPAAGRHLPYADRYSVAVGAGPAATWEALLRIVDGSFSTRATARVASRRLLGAVKRRVERSEQPHGEAR
ncbi:MAG TPA: hypothetical protein VFU04_04530 [Solirubrobacterales bacterium]|nr:hypothetical protein [Solirubrobacterales bacterium]